MTFLNSALLAALSLGLIPILIHLLNRQRFKQVEFPTLRFLQEMQRQKMRRVKVRQWILLALRTLAVVALVLAMARPVLKSEAGIIGGGEARASVILVLDRTASMSTESEGGTRFRELQVRAQEIVKSLGSNDEIQLVWADATPTVYPDSPTQHRALIGEAIEAATTSEAGGSLIDAVGMARSLLGKSQNLLKEVYVLSDFSASAWPDELPQVPILPDDVRLYVLPVGSAQGANIGVTSSEIISRLIVPGRSVELGFELTNSSDSDVKDRIVSVYLDGKRVAQTRISLGVGETREERIRFVPESVGELSGYVRLEDTDTFAGDDIRRFVLRVPGRLNVAVAGSDGPSRRLTALALDPTSRGESFIHVLELSALQLEAEDWNVFDALFIVDAPQFSGAFAERARAYLHSGRGIFIAGGPNFDARSHSAWMQSIGLPAASGVEQLGESGIKWSKVDLDHPLFEGVFQDKPVDVSPEFKQRFELTRGTSGAASIIESSDGKAFLVEATQGRGRALFLNSSPDPDWSTLYRTGIFSPLMTGSAAYLAGTGGAGMDYTLTVGKPAEIILRNSDQLQYDLVKDALSTRLTAVPVTGGQLVKFPALESTGEYLLKQEGRTVKAIVVNIPEEESEVQAVANEEMFALLGGQISELSRLQSIESTIREGRYGRELWKLFLYLALGLLVTEMLIARTPKKDSLAPELA